MNKFWIFIMEKEERPIDVRSVANDPEYIVNGTIW